MWNSSCNNSNVPYNLSLLSHQATERRRERTNFIPKNISLCEILVVTTPMFLICWDRVGMMRFRVWFQQKEKEGKKTYKRKECFQVAYHWRLKFRHQSTKSKIVHPKLGMLTLYTIPKHIKVTATENRENLHYGQIILAQM